MTVSDAESSLLFVYASLTEFLLLKTVSNRISLDGIAATVSSLFLHVVSYQTHNNIFSVRYMGVV